MLEGLLLKCTLDRLLFTTITSLSYRGEANFFPQFLWPVCKFSIFFSLFKLKSDVAVSCLSNLKIRGNIEERVNMAFMNNFEVDAP